MLMPCPAPVQYTCYACSTDQKASLCMCAGPSSRMQTPCPSLLYYTCTSGPCAFGKPVCVCVQAKAIRSLGGAAEAVTVGHNPYCKASAMDHSIILPTTRKRFCCEVQFTYAYSTPSQHCGGNQLVDWPSISTSSFSAHACIMASECQQVKKNGSKPQQCV